MREGTLLYHSICCYQVHSQKVHLWFLAAQRTRRTGSPQFLLIYSEAWQLLHRLHLHFWANIRTIHMTSLCQSNIKVDGSFQVFGVSMPSCKELTDLPEVPGGRASNTLVHSLQCFMISGIKSSPGLAEVFRTPLEERKTFEIWPIWLSEFSFHIFHLKQILGLSQIHLKMQGKDETSSSNSMKAVVWDVTCTSCTGFLGCSEALCLARLKISERRYSPSISTLCNRIPRDVTGITTKYQSNLLFILLKPP